MSTACVVPGHYALSNGVTGSASPVDGLAQAARHQQPKLRRHRQKTKGGKLYSKLNGFEEFTKYLVNFSKPVSYTHLTLPTIYSV